MAAGNLSLQELDGDDWGDPPADATHVIATVHKLRRTPVGSLDAEGLRMLMSQQVGTDVLVPIALTRLEQDPLLAGDLYPGDVLAVVLRLPQSYWSSNPAQRSALRRIIASIEDPESTIKAAIEAFKTANPR
jgi:hypothetical protein